MAAEVEPLGTLERVLALKKLPAFAELQLADLATLARSAMPRRLAPGAALPVDGDGGSVHFLLEGSVRDGSADRREAPAVLGMVEVLAGSRPPELLAETESRTLEIRRRALVDVLEDEFEVWLATLRHVCASALERGMPVEPPAAEPGATAPRAADLADLAERIALLRRIPPFAGLGIHPLGQIASAMEPLVVEPGHRFWGPDDPAGHLLAITAGEVRCTGADGTVRDFGARSLLGLAEALCVDRHGYAAEARGVVHALRLDTETLIDVLEDDPDAGVGLLCVIARGAVRAAAQEPDASGDDAGGNEDGS
jgi:hypothetical protein